MSTASSVASSHEVSEKIASLQSGEDVVAAICAELNPGSREQSVRRFVKYFYTHEKNRNRSFLTQQEVQFVLEKCLTALRQGRTIQLPRNKKLHAGCDLRSRTKICAKHRVHGSPVGTRGWVRGWLTARPTDSRIDLELDEPMFVTKMMMCGTNTKASPRNIELYAKDENDQWQLVRQFVCRERRFIGYREDGSFMSRTTAELFYILGHANNQNDEAKRTWEVHPLVGQGRITMGEPDFYVSSKFWRLRIVNSHGSHYVGINDFRLYGRRPVFLAPKDVKAVPHSTGARVSWELSIDENAQRPTVDTFQIIAYPGGFNHRSCGGFYEQCPGTSSFYDFLNLSPETQYQFQVVAFDAAGNEGIPSRASNPMTVDTWHLDEDAAIQGISESMEEPEICEDPEPVILDGSGKPSMADLDHHTCFCRDLDGTSSTNESRHNRRPRGFQRCR